MRVHVLSTTIPALALLFLPACSSAPASGTVASSQASLASPPPPSAPEAVAPPPRPLLDEALVEGPHDRDPFRAFKAVDPPPPPDARPRKAHRIPIDQLKLVALVTHTAIPRAMLVDPAGKGYVVTQGELVGRPEAEGDHFASFRVDRIRDGDVVLVREDASDPRAPISTRVLAIQHEPLLQADD